MYGLGVKILFFRHLALLLCARFIVVKKAVWLRHQPSNTCGAAWVHLSTERSVSQEWCWRRNQSYRFLEYCHSSNHLKRSHYSRWSPSLYLLQASVWPDEWVSTFSSALRSTTFLCQCWRVWGIPCWGGERVSAKKRGGKESSVFTGCFEGHRHLVAKEWLIREAGTNKRFVCPHISLAVTALSLSGILQIPPSLSSAASRAPCQIFILMVNLQNV